MRNICENNYVNFKLRLMTDLCFNFSWKIAPLIRQRNPPEK